MGKEKNWLSFFREMIEGLNVATASIIISLICTIFGIILIFLQIRDTGSIDVKTPFLTGKIESGFVGITLTFLGIIIAGLCLRAASRREVQIKAEKASLTFKGPYSRKAMFEFLDAVAWDQEMNQASKKKDKIDVDNIAGGSRLLEGEEKLKTGKFLDRKTDKEKRDTNNLVKENNGKLA